MSRLQPEQAIGIFDSGLGGISVVRALIDLLPHEHLIYFGDTARVPYGSKSRETVIRFSRQISSFLLEQQVKMIVVACNTASSVALDDLQRQPVKIAPNTLGVQSNLRPEVVAKSLFLLGLDDEAFKRHDGHLSRLVKSSKMQNGPVRLLRSSRLRPGPSFVWSRRFSTASLARFWLRLLCVRGP
jgi:hypothetical protein